MHSSHFTSLPILPSAYKYLSGKILKYAALHFYSHQNFTVQHTKASFPSLLANPYSRSKNDTIFLQTNVGHILYTLMYFYC